MVDGNIGGEGGKKSTASKVRMMIYVDNSEHHDHHRHHHHHYHHDNHHYNDYVDQASAHCEKLFRVIDIDGDGTLTEKEFLRVNYGGEFAIQ